MMQFLQSGRGVAAALAAILIFPVVAAAQNPPLAEVAKKEQERRKAMGVTKSVPKVLTNKDLPKSATQQPGSAPSGTAPAAASDPHQRPPADQKPAAGADATQKPEGAKDEAWWRARITQAREALRRNEMFIEALQSRINGLTTDFVNRDDPYQRAKIGEDRQKALDELARVKGEIDAGKKLIDDIEEEARRAGVPPGWLR
jgi:hypothetical protein